VSLQLISVIILYFSALANLGIAEVVGSNPTRSTIFNLVKYGIGLSSLMVVVRQKP
jgi:hypothetical protein